jgi:hypothetical protein
MWSEDELVQCFEVLSEGLIMLNEASQTYSSSLPTHAVATPATLSNDVRLQRVLERVPQLSEIAVQLFPGTISAEVEEDPEIEDWKYVVFTVHAPSDLNEVMRRHLEWFRLTAELLGDDVDLVHLFPLFS